MIEDIVEEYKLFTNRDLLIKFLDEIDIFIEKKVPEAYWPGKESNLSHLFVVIQQRHGIFDEDLPNRGSK